MHLEKNASLLTRYTSDDYFRSRLLQLESGLICSRDGGIENVHPTSKIGRASFFRRLNSSSWAESSRLFGNGARSKP
jgi:hypothetical protein